MEQDGTAKLGKVAVFIKGKTVGLSLKVGAFLTIKFVQRYLFRPPPFCLLDLRARMGSRLLFSLSFFRAYLLVLLFVLIFSFSLISWRLSLLIESTPALLQQRVLLQSCRNACGFCGKDTIVEQCTDTSCKFDQRLENWSVVNSTASSIRSPTK